MKSATLPLHWANGGGGGELEAAAKERERGAMIGANQTIGSSIETVTARRLLVVVVVVVACSSAVGQSAAGRIQDDSMRGKVLVRLGESGGHESRLAPAILEHTISEGQLALPALLLETAETAQYSPAQVARGRRVDSSCTARVAPVARRAARRVHVGRRVAPVDVTLLVHYVHLTLDRLEDVVLGPKGGGVVLVVVVGFLEGRRLSLRVGRQRRARRT